MTSSAKHPATRKFHSVTAHRRKADRSRFRQMMFESLEERRVLSSFPAPITSWQQAEFVDNELLVKFRSDATPIQIQMAMAMAQAHVVSDWDNLNIKYLRFFTPHNRDQTLAAIKMLHENAAVEYAEPNFRYHKEVIPNDPLFGLQWGLHNVGQVSPFIPGFGGQFDADIDAPEAWDETTGNPNTIIAIVDTGTDYTHPDLASKIWVNQGEIPDGIDNDGNGWVDDVRGYDFGDLDDDPMDEDGHGTHVAGIAAAIGNNNTGVTGVSWNSQIMVLKGTDQTGTFPSSGIVGAQAYILRMREQFGLNIVVSNNSYGALGPAAFSFAQYDAIRRATEAGVPFVAAAGNNGLNTDGATQPHYPSNYNLPGVIAVASTNRVDGLSIFSNFGINSVDLGAPGEEILSTWLPGGARPAQPPNQPPDYTWLDGTSMASPMVAGAVAVLRSFDPFLTNDEVKTLLMTTVDVVPSLALRTKSGGRLNLAKAIDQITRNEISGRVWRDLDADGRIDSSEIGLGGWTVYVDRNNNKILDSFEPSTVSQADGTYLLRSTLGAGTFKVREIVRPGYKQTFPTQASDFAHTIVLQSRSDTVNNIHFGNQPLPGSIDGIKYLDIDKVGNTLGQRDVGEPGLEGFVIYVDVNSDGLIGVGEPASVTDAQGRFRINNVLPGDYIVREVQRPGFLQTEPDPSLPNAGGISVTVVGSQTTFGLVFGNRAAVDWGDAPISYGTLSANNGARHGLLSGFYLGDATDTTSTHVDDELNGIPSADADGDDLTNLDDEDGVSFLTPVVPGQNATIRVDVSSGSFGSGFLQGWIDYNNDGDFLDAGEQILKDKALATGTHLFTFLIPADASIADTFSRFRWSLQRGIGPTGPAIAGEVEDHPTSARAVSPTANDDGPFTVGRDSTFIDNEFDVLANDFPGVGGDPFRILSVDATSDQGGLVQIDVANNTVRYQPPPDFIGQDSFRYIITDDIHPPSNPGTVTINVVPTDPVAVDDTFDISVGSANVPLDVLLNDIEGLGGALNVVAISPRSAGGQATYNAGTRKIVYTPPSPTFSGADTFSYTVSDGSKISSANVLVQIGGPAPNQIVQIEYKVFNDQGQELGIGGAPAPAIGDTITMVAFTRDLRGSFPDPIVPGIPDASGVLSAYADVLYPKAIVRPLPANNVYGIDITFGPFYTSFESATSSNPGIVDEAGATDTDFEYALDSNDNLLFSIKFTVRANGSLQFLGNPEEDSAQFIFETQVHSQVTGAPIVVDNDDIFFKHSPTIQVGPNPEGEATNLFNPLDVNQDTLVTPNDASLVINHLNRFGPGPYSPMLAAALGQGVPQYFLDVNADGSVSPFDAKLVVDYLNLKANQSHSSSSQAAEGESDSGAVVSQALGPTAKSSSSTSLPSSDDSSDQANYANSVDRLLSSDGFAASGISAVTSPVDDNDDHEEEEEDVFFADLESK